MAKKEEKINFDLSALSLQELIETYNNIDEFMTFLKDSKIEIEEKEEEDDE
jgi:methionyl-tRNA formyltransferase